MILTLINFPVPPNARMLKACVNPDGCNRRIAELKMVDGQQCALCYCPAWGVSKYGKKIIYACGLEQKVEQMPI